MNYLKINIECIDYELKPTNLIFPLTAKLFKNQLDSHPEIDGVFSDRYYCILCNKIYFGKMGKKLPDDYIIVGYDGVDISNYVYPSLSYVRQPFESLLTLLLMYC